jgi:IMP dehydrogenase
MTSDKHEPIGVADDDPGVLGLVEDVMTRDVVTISDDEPLSYAARELERAGVSGAPVLREGRVVGIITLSDLLAHVGGRPAQVSTTGPFHRVEHLLADASPGAIVREAMTSRVRTVMVQDTLVEAARIMIEAGVNRLPVVDERGSPCGIVTRDDVVAAVARGGGR